MTTTVSAMDLVVARRARWEAAQAVDQATVDRIVSEAADASREKIIFFVKRTHDDIQRGYRRGGLSLETMAASADALTAILAAQN